MNTDFEVSSIIGQVEYFFPVVLSRWRKPLILALANLSEDDEIYCGGYGAPDLIMLDETGRLESTRLGAIMLKSPSSASNCGVVIHLKTPLASQTDSASWQKYRGVSLSES